MEIQVRGSAAMADYSYGGAGIFEASAPGSPSERRALIAVGVRVRDSFGGLVQASVLFLDGLPDDGLDVLGL